MIVDRRETCLEYFRRRLAEGWTCIEFAYPYAVLLSPEGTRRPIDLRNDTLTLRPNAASVTNLIEAGSAPNWRCVDEAGGGNGDTDYVYHITTNTWKYDLYGLPNHTAESGTINKVTIYVRHKWFTTAGNKARTIIKTHGVLYRGPDVSLTAAYVLSSKQYANNPNTSSAWTWAEVDALTAGWDGYAWWNPVLKILSRPRCTQVYVEVDYTGEPVPTTLVLTPMAYADYVGKEYELTAKVYDGESELMAGVGVTWSIVSGVGEYKSYDSETDESGEAKAIYTSDEVGNATVKCEVDDYPAVSDTAASVWYEYPARSSFFEMF